MYFLLALSFYYGCDALLEAQPMRLAPDQLARCGGYYEAVKSAFVAADALPPPGRPEAEATRRAAFAAFKVWERENALLTRALRDAARTQASR